MPVNDQPILLIDSGLGGLTVARAILRALPGQSILYFGDTARLPYGSKSPATVTAFVRQILRYCASCHPRHVVLACNTASALALPALRQEMLPLTVSGVIDPGAKAASHACGAKSDPVIGVIATEATIRSDAYPKAIRQRRQKCRIYLRAAPLLVPAIEEGRGNDDPVVQLALERYLAPLIEMKIDALVLGCTHYPLLRKAIRRIVGPDVALIDSAATCAHDVARRLGETPVLATRQSPDVNAASMDHRLSVMVTDDASRFRKLASRFLGFEIAEPRLISVEELTSIPPTDRLRVSA